MWEKLDIVNSFSLCSLVSSEVVEAHSKYGGAKDQDIKKGVIRIKPSNKPKPAAKRGTVNEIITSPFDN